MALLRSFGLNARRGFSTSSQNWTENRIQNYDVKREWVEVVDVPRYIRKGRQTQKSQYFGNQFRDQLVGILVKTGQTLKYKGEFTKYLKQRRRQKAILSQTYIQERVDILGPDLAVAHFVLARGGSVRFWRDNEWHNIKNPQTKLPRVYLPGYYIEGINLFGTNLYQEGLESLRHLNKLKWLSLKELHNLDDFALDFISGHYGHQLEYLDLGGCKGITHYGLSCLYRFQKLKYLNVTGIEQSPEFKLCCLMIEDLLPNLHIKGVDYSDYTEDGDKTIENTETEKKDLSSVLQ